MSGTPHPLDRPHGHRRLSSVMIAFVMTAWMGASVLATAGMTAPADHAETLERFNKYIRDKNDDARATVVRSIHEVDTAAGVESVASVLDDESWKVRAAALEVLSGYKSAEAVTAMHALAESGRPDERAIVIQALGRVGAPSSAERLLLLADDRAWQVRRAAAEAYGAYAKSNKEADTAALVGALLGMIADKEPVVRTIAAASLGRIGDGTATSALVGLLGDESWQVRASAVQALSKLRQKEAIEPLIALMQEEGRLQDDAARALKSITSLDFGVDPDGWKSWWARTKDRFEVPELPKPGRTRRPATAKSPNDPAQRDRAEARYKASKRYYGIPTPSQRILFILDVSRSMRDEVDILKPERLVDLEMTSGRKIDIAKAELKRAINSFEGRTAINILVYHTEVDRWSKKLVELTDSKRRQAIAFIDKQEPRGRVGPVKSRPGRRAAAPNTDEGRTNIYGALAAAFKVSGIGTYDKHYDTAVDTIFLLSDGSPTAGELTNPQEILEEIRRLNSLRRVVIHTINFGKDPAGSGLLQGLANQNGGVFVDLVGSREGALQK